MKIKKILGLWRLFGFCVVCVLAGVGIMLSCQDRQEEVNAVSGLSGKTVLIDGDSIAEGHGAYSTSRFPGWSYANYLEETYGMGKTNVAFSGATFSVTNQYCTDVINCYIANHLTDTIKNTKYDYIILEGASNDLHFNYYYGDTTSYATELRRYFDTVTSNEKWKDAKIGFVIVPHPNYSIRTGFDPVKDAVFWQSIQRICDEYSIEYINFNKLQANDSFVVPSGFNWNIMNNVAASAEDLGSFDGLHPTKGTHRVLGEYIANWMVNLPNYKYTVTFDKNGASMSNIASQTVVHGKTASQPTYTISNIQHFSHWSTTRGGAAYNFSSGINENLTLYAVWNANVVFNMNGGTLNGQTTKTVSVNGGGTVSNPGSPVKDGKVFKYWAADAACGAQYNFASGVNGDMTLYACYNSEYKLTLDANGGTGSVAVLACEVTSGDYCTIAIPSSGVSREEYYLIGYGENAGSGKPDYEVGGVVTMKGDKTIYAIWADGRVEQRESDKEYTIGDGADMVIKINYPLVHFVGLKVDNKAVDNQEGDKYKLEDGSTIITVFSSYLDTLEPGEHTIQAEYDNGVTRGVEFAVKEKPADEPVVDPTDEPADEPADEPVNGGGNVTPAPNTGGNTNSGDSVSGVWLYFLPSMLMDVGALLVCRKLSSRGRHRKFD